MVALELLGEGETDRVLNAIHVEDAIDPEAVLLELDLSVALGEQDATKADMFDTEIARRVGESLGADAFVTGYLVPLTDSVIVFARLIEVETGTVVSATQTVMNLTPELLDLVDREF